VGVGTGADVGSDVGSGLGARVTVTVARGGVAPGCAVEHAVIDHGTTVTAASVSIAVRRHRVRSGGCEVMWWSMCSGIGLALLVPGASTVPLLI
jgi:hypothetical protein